MPVPQAKMCPGGAADVSLMETLVSTLIPIIDSYSTTLILAMLL